MRSPTLHTAIAILSLATAAQAAASGDLRIELSAPKSTDLITPASVIINVNNDGPGSTDEVTTTIATSDLARIIDIKVALGSCSFDQQITRCVTPPLAAGATESIEVTLEPVWLGAVVLSAVASTAQPDLNPLNNQIVVPALTVEDTDVDRDSVADSVDNCALIQNQNQRDTNSDGFGNSCDADLNNDGVVNFQDLGLLRQAFFTNDPDADLSGDGTVGIVDLGLMRSLFFTSPGPSGILPPAGSQSGVSF
ncbi:MAG: thrombospondin type 3 repeat-containing protein [Gammaproteobacteria bacterium]